MTDTITGQGTTISRYRSKRQKSRDRQNKAADIYEDNSIDASSLSSKQGHSLCAVRISSLHTIEQSLNQSQPTAARHQDGPPRSSEINATTIPKTRRVPNKDDEGHTGCFNFLRRGRKCRAEPACATKAAAGGSPENSAARHICSACSKGAYEQSNASILKRAESEVSRLTYARGYHRGKVEVSGFRQEPANQDSVTHLAVNTLVASRDWQSLEIADSAMDSYSRGFDNPSPRSPYDMRHGAVQPQYFCTDETLMYRHITRNEFDRQSSVQRRTTISSTLSDIRSGTTLSTSHSIRHKPLVDLTPRYQPPPQHRNKGHGYYPDRLGGEKLVDFATSPKK